MFFPRFGQLQLRIMSILWEKKWASAREITDMLNEKGERPIAHSTVQTLLRKMEDKGAVGHEIEERTFVFRSLVAEDAVYKEAAKDFIGRFFEGSSGRMATYLLDHRFFSHAEMVALQENLAKHLSKKA